jgi:hypothetical protein
VAKLERPLDPKATAAADEQLYALHENDPRPNALYDAQGNRLRLRISDPSQEGLRQQWRDLYREAKANGDQPGPKADAPPASGNGQSAGDPPPPSDRPVSDPVLKCRPLHWIKIRLIRLPYRRAPPAWWLAEDSSPYAYEPFVAEITDGHKTGATDRDRAVRYDEIPAGTCSIQYDHFFDAIEKL